MFSPDFWTSPSCHVAVNPHRPHEADGLIEFAQQMGWQAKCFFQTSGSEGAPKWVVLSKQAFLVSAKSVNAHFEVTPKDRWLIALPLHHVGGFSIMARAHLSGSDFVQQTERWDPRAFTDLCEREGITLASLVPTQLHDLVTQGLACPEKLRAVIIGGGAMSQVLRKAASALGWPVYQSYGMTEAASQIATQSQHSSEDEISTGVLEVLEHWQVSTDAAGHLILSGPALAVGYLSRDSIAGWHWTAMAPTFKTRDLVHLSSSGKRQLLQFVGRESGVIKILGELIHLSPLQAILDQILWEQGSGCRPIILPVPDPRQEMKLVLIVDSGDPEPWLIAYNQAVGALCRISETQRVSQIPRTDLGKVDRQALLQLLKCPENLLQ